MTIPVKRLGAERLSGAPADGMVVRASVLASAHDAQGIVEQARLEAERLIEAARARVDEETLARQAELEQRAWRKAADYAAAVNAEWERSIGELERSMADVLGRAVRRLAGELPAEQRLRACIHQLTSQIGVPDTGTLLVAEEDLETVRAMTDGLPWPVQGSGELPAGSVRLVSAQGRWECDVNGSLERLLQALNPLKEPSAEDRHG